MIRRTGLLYAYPDRQVFTGEALAWRLRRENGVAWRELDAEALRAFEPRLDPHYRFWALVEAAPIARIPGLMFAALARAAVARGAMLVRARALDFRHAGKQITAVMLDQGDIACDAAVIAAGIHAAPCRARPGIRCRWPVSEGYHVVVTDPGFALPTRLCRAMA